ncbi:MAG: hypothetical protein AUJ12_07925 [Alphaproteobacteria bacterium CG1_02_46_17]|nr:MAG: hypothetical protein AUJ12_07925 [Alphaproteobacteria bacterium CG1_02_46_17]
MVFLDRKCKLTYCSLSQKIYDEKLVELPVLQAIATEAPWSALDISAALAEYYEKRVAAMMPAPLQQASPSQDRAPQ